MYRQFLVQFIQSYNVCYSFEKFLFFFWWFGFLCTNSIASMLCDLIFNRRSFRVLDLVEFWITFLFSSPSLFAFDLNLIFLRNALSDVETCWFLAGKLNGRWQIIYGSDRLMASFDETLTMILSNYSNK